jgi:VanZ family protein
MSASPLTQYPPQSFRPSRPISISNQWLAVLGALAFVACTSTKFMGCYTTQAIVDFFWKIFLGTAHHDQAGLVNALFRKYGHFFGYGLISLVFRKAWYNTARAYAWVTRNRLTLFAGTLAVLSTFAVSGLDEWHQHFVPGRVGCLSDALVDTAGALFVNVAFWSIRARRRRQAIPV